MPPHTTSVQEYGPDTVTSQQPLTSKVKYDRAHICRERPVLGEDAVNRATKRCRLNLACDISLDVVSSEVCADAVADFPFVCFDTFADRDDFACRIGARD